MRERALQQPVGEAAVHPRGHDRQLERAGGRTRLVGEERRGGRVAVRLDGGEELERARPVAVERVDALVGPSRGGDDQRRAPAAPRVGAHDRAGGADAELEGRVGRLADHRPRVRVEEDGALVARRVLELLDHQLAPARGRGPVDAPEAVARRVLAHRVELVARRAPQDEVPPAGVLAALVREELVQLDEPRQHEQRLGADELDLDPLEPERVLEHDAGRLDRVAAPRDVLEDVAASQPAAPSSCAGGSRSPPAAPAARARRA